MPRRKQRDPGAGDSVGPDSTNQATRAISKRFAAALEAHMKATGKKKEFVAQRAGIHTQNLSRLLSGSAPVTVDMAVKLSIAAEVDLMDLLTEESFEEKQRRIAQDIVAGGVDVDFATVYNAIRTLAQSPLELARLESLIEAIRSPIASIINIEDSAIYLKKIGDWLRISQANAPTTENPEITRRIRSIGINAALGSLKDWSERTVDIFGRQASMQVMPTSLPAYVKAHLDAIDAAADLDLQRQVIFGVSTLLPSKWYSGETKDDGAIEKYRQRVQKLIQNHPKIQFHRLVITRKDHDPRFSKGKALGNAVEDPKGILTALDSEKDAKSEPKNVVRRFVKELHTDWKHAKIISIAESDTVGFEGKEISVKEFSESLTQEKGTEHLFDLWLVGQFPSGAPRPRWLFGISGGVDYSEHTVPFALVTDQDVLNYAGNFWYEMYERAPKWLDFIGDRRVDPS